MNADYARRPWRDTRAISLVSPASLPQGAGSRRWFFARLLTQHVLITVVIEQLTELGLPIVLFRLTFRDLEVRHVGSLGRVNLVCHVSLQNINRLGGDGVYTRRSRLLVPLAPPRCTATTASQGVVNLGCRAQARRLIRVRKR
jgi:hypothetical protein